jgi:hypothetical protein
MLPTHNLMEVARNPGRCMALEAVKRTGSLTCVVLLHIASIFKLFISNLFILITEAKTYNMYHHCGFENVQKYHRKRIDLQYRCLPVPTQAGVEK